MSEIQSQLTLQVIFYRYLEPEKFADNRLRVQLGKLKGKRKKTYEWDSSTMMYQGFINWKAKQLGLGTVFRHILDQSLTLEQVVNDYDIYVKFVQASGNLLRLDLDINAAIIDGLEHGLSNIILTPAMEQIVKEAYLGGLTYAEKGWQGVGWKYDITSCYPSIAASDRLFPVGQPVLQDIDAIEDTDIPAIYLAHVNTENAPSFIFKRVDNKPRWWTNVELNIAMDLELEVTLESGLDGYNCLSFPNSMPGSELFGHYFRSFFQVKKTSTDPDIQGKAKYCLNKACGLMAKYCKRRYGKDSSFALNTRKSGEKVIKVELDENGEVAQIMTLAEGKLFAYHHLCHLPAFITAYAREHIVNLFLDYHILPHIKALNTDGWLLDKPVTWRDNQPQELGGIKLEEHGHCQVYHCRKIVFTCPPNIR